MTFPNFAIRLANPDDAVELAALSIQVWLHTYATEGIRRSIAEYVLGEFTPEKVRAEINAPDKTILTAHVDGHLVGFALLNHHSACEFADDISCELDRLYVQAHFARKGIGSALLAACLDDVKNRGPRRGLWLSMYTGNQTALAFYSRQGLRVCGSTFFEFGGERHENLVLVAE